MPGAPEHSLWEHVQDAENRVIAQRAGDDGVAGLAISGGGIRSATFALGILDSLKDCGLLSRFHYLSTVSGGGYIGAWLSANCRRHAAAGSSRRRLDRVDRSPAALLELPVAAGRLLQRRHLVDGDDLAAQHVPRSRPPSSSPSPARCCVPRPLFEVFQHWPEAGDLPVGHDRPVHLRHRRHRRQSLATDRAQAAGSCCLRARRWPPSACCRRRPGVAAAALALFMGAAR